MLRLCALGSIVCVNGRVKSSSLTYRPSVFTFLHTQRLVDVGLFVGLCAGYVSDGGISVHGGEHAAVRILFLRIIYGSVDGRE